MKNTRVARRYAHALMQSADSVKAIDAYASDLELIKQTVTSSRELRLFINRPIVSAEKKMAILRELFGTSIGKATMSFVELLVGKQREGHLLEVIEQYFALRDMKYGILNVEVSSAVEISKPQEKNLTDKLEQYTKKKVRIRFALDTALKGGLVVRIGDTVLDASVKRQLELLREQFMGGHPLN
jgi:F-type H+-transporting ATPase subunit delta